MKFKNFEAKRNRQYFFACYETVEQSEVSISHIHAQKIDST